MIPKTINYCWFGKKQLPNNIKKNIESWKKYCPDFQIKEWNEDNYNVNRNDFVAQAYKDKAWAFVSDYARLDIIYNNGGIYLDTDVELIRSIDDLLENHAFVALQHGMICATGLGFGAEPQNKVIKKMLDMYSGLQFNLKNQEAIACPKLNDPVIRSLGYTNTDKIVKLPMVTIYPPQYFDPYSPGFYDDLMTECTYSIHHYDASWTNNRKRLKRKFIRHLGLLIGQEKVHSLKIYLSRIRHL